MQPQHVIRNSMHFDVRLRKDEVKREGDPINGKVVTDASMEISFNSNSLKSVKSNWLVY